MAKERLSYEEVELNLSQGGVINVQEGSELHINGTVYVNGVLLEPAPPVVP
jgi:hypothetical protein